MLRNYLITAWRNIKKHAGFSLINAGGLTIGIASCILLLLYIFYHVSFNRQFHQLENIYTVENNQKGDGKIYTFEATPGQAAEAIKREIPGVEAVTRAVDYNASGLVSYQNKHLKRLGLFADSGFFNIFSFHFLKGNPRTALTQPNAIVLSESLAKALFGNEDPMNKIVTRNNEIPLMVSGVIAEMPANNLFHHDFILPYAQFELATPFIKEAGWGTNFANTYVKLKPNTSVAKANQLMAGMVDRYDKGNTNQLFLYPLSALHLHSRFTEGKVTGGLIDQIRMFGLLAAVILLIACVNFMNLSTARSEKRAREVGIRKAIGSDKKSLVLQFITESVLLSAIATLTAVLLVILCLPSFNSLLNMQLSIPYKSPWTWLSIAALAVITGFISGSYPAFYLSAFEPVKVLKGLFKGGKGALSIRKVLVVMQFSIAVFLITATVCIYRQMRFIQNLPTGYNGAGLIEIPVEGNLARESGNIIQQLKTKGAITYATGESKSINQSGYNTWGVSWPGKDPNQQILIDIYHAGYDFTQTTGIKLLAGREFSPGYPADTTGKTVMINETAARLMNLKNPIGTEIKWGDNSLTVIGMYKDFVTGQPYNKVAPMISCYNGFKDAQDLLLRTNPAKSISACVADINAVLATANPGFPSTIRFVDTEFEYKFQNERMLATLSNLFGGLAIIISCLGLFGLAAFAAEQRIKEIGVRKVLGASITNLAALLSGEFIKLVSIAIIIAVPISVIILNKWLNNYEYRIPLSWHLFVLAGAITLLIAVATVSYQAIKAALANPIKSLKRD